MTEYLPANVLKWVNAAVFALDDLITIIAIGVVPENRRPSSSQAWLLLILLLPFVGLPLFLLIASPSIQGRRHQIQARANAELLARTSALPELPSGVSAPDRICRCRRAQPQPRVVAARARHPTGRNPGYGNSIAAMIEAVRSAKQVINFEIDILALEAVAQQYRDLSQALDLASWNARPWPGRYIDNVMRLTSALQ